jgi:hypothetical protein
MVKYQRIEPLCRCRWQDSLSLTYQEHLIVCTELLDNSSANNGALSCTSDSLWACFARH